jgi:hypothetical protein
LKALEIEFNQRLELFMTTANLSYDPLAAFAIRLSTPGFGGDYAAGARAEIERRFGPEVAEDFAAAYRDSDMDAANRVAKKLAGDIDFTFTKDGGSYLGEAIADNLTLSSKGSASHYRSDAHFLLQFGLEMVEANEKKQKLVAEQAWAPPLPHPPELKKAKIF